MRSAMKSDFNGQANDETILWHIYTYYLDSKSIILSYMLLKIKWTQYTIVVETNKYN